MTHASIVSEDQIHFLLGLLTSILDNFRLICFQKRSLVVDVLVYCYALDTGIVPISRRI